MTILLISLVALFLGPIVLRLIGERREVVQFLDGLVLASIGALVLGAFLPHAVEEGGALAAFAFVFGLVVPSIAEKIKGAVHERVHSAAVYVGMGALVLHAVADGVAFADSGVAGQGALAVAVLLHRLPVGLAVWWLVRTTHGTRGALLVLVAIAAATGVGYAAGAQFGLIHTTGFTILLSFVAGSLFHVLMHQHLPHAFAHAGDGYRFAEFGGALVGFAAIFLAMHLGQFDGGSHGHDAFAGRFVHYALESAPALLFGYVLAGLIVFFLPAASVQWLRRGSRAGQAGRGVVFGLPLPVCSCGVVPLYDGLVRAGVPASAGLAFLVATPELGIEAFVLSFPLLGLELTMLRLAAAAILAFTVALLVQRWIVPQERRDELQLGHVETESGGARRVLEAIRYGLVDVLDDTAVWVLAGITIAALIAPGVIEPLVAGLPFGVDVVLCAVIGIPMYVCASGATPLAAALIAGGVSPGAGITFLLSGPATNVTTFGMLAKLHGQRVALAFGLSVVSVSILLGLGVNAWTASADVFAVPVEMQHGVVGWLALAVLAVAFLGAMLRQGPRSFLSTLFEFGGGHSHEDHETEAAPCCSGHAA